MSGPGLGGGVLPEAQSWSGPCVAPAAATAAAAAAAAAAGPGADVEQEGWRAGGEERACSDCAAAVGLGPAVSPPAAPSAASIKSPAGADPQPGAQAASLPGP